MGRHSGQSLSQDDGRAPGDILEKLSSRLGKCQQVIAPVLNRTCHHWELGQFCKSLLDIGHG